MIGPVKSWRWHWMPAAFFLFGMFSVVLFLWIERIDEKLHNNTNIIEAIMDIQIRTATFHLRVEESLYGYSSIDPQKVIGSLEQAIKLAEVTLTGGETEHAWIAEPLGDRQLRDRAGAIRSLLMQFREYGLERLKYPQKSGIGSVNENKFETAFKEILEKSKELGNILEKDEDRERKKTGRLFFAILVVWISIVVAATAGFVRSERKRRKAEENLLKSNEQLLSHTEELTQHREQLSIMVEKRTTELTVSNKLLTGEIDEREHTEKALRETEAQVREISARLLEAQEIERRRISMELHDELGQALNVMKLQVRFIEKKLDAGQGELRRECEELLAYSDQLIENVRRLSRDLSPTVLEDIGLTASIQWLVSNLTKNPALKVTSDIPEIDDLISVKNRIVIYRVIQEALTNIVKHSRAESVLFVIRRHDGGLIFTIEDDGEGFDPESISINDIYGKGFGLRTMKERVRTIGGDFNLFSRQGMGTRITFSVPVMINKQEIKMENRK